MKKTQTKYSLATPSVSMSYFGVQFMTGNLPIHAGIEQMVQVFLVGVFFTMAIRPLIQNVYWSFFARLFIFSILLIILGPLVSWREASVLSLSQPTQLFKFLIIDSLSIFAVLISSALVFKPQHEYFTFQRLWRKLFTHCQLWHSIHLGFSMAFYCWLIFIIAEFLPIQYAVSALVLKAFAMTLIVMIFGNLFRENETTFETSVAFGILTFVIGDAIPVLSHFELNWEKTLSQLIPMLFINFVFCYTNLTFSKKFAKENLSIKSFSKKRRLGTTIRQKR